MLEFKQTNIDPDGRVPHYVQIIFDDDRHADAEEFVNDQLSLGYVPLVGKIRPSFKDKGQAVVGQVHGRKADGHLKYLIVLIKI